MIASRMIYNQHFPNVHVREVLIFLIYEVVSYCFSFVALFFSLLLQADDFPEIVHGIR